MRAGWVHSRFAGRLSPALTGNSRYGPGPLSQLPRHLLGADRGAHRGEQPVRLAQVAQTRGLVAGEPRQIGPLEVDERLVLLSTGLTDQARCLCERRLHGALCVRAPAPQEHTPPGWGGLRIPTFSSRARVPR